MLEKVQLIPPEQLHEFPNHPFEVREDEEMQKMVESVRLYGVLTPLIARPLPDGGFEIVAGHHRRSANMAACAAAICASAVRESIQACCCPANWRPTCRRPTSRSARGWSE